MNLSGMAREDGELMRRYRESTPAWSPASARPRIAAFQVEESLGGEDEESRERASDTKNSPVFKQRTDVKLDDTGKRGRRHRRGYRRTCIIMPFSIDGRTASLV